ncbi:hypothetical protein Rhopal_001212-T1 [Rhodotorula paludigena]|uniref:Proteophosphoglycan ppg4 n=1 Tax=Rhodotorula paludigena TaxID=86838 RepID=A0AAV5GFX9_9BASI|nr:hypothetical protein Rhopal_001212-T1 [Rhodotorula paludigena]
MAAVASSAPTPAPAPAPAAATVEVKTPAAADKAASGSADVAKEAVAAKPSNAEDASALLSPSLSDILAAYRKDGKEDAELLKLLIKAKTAEDERLAALDKLRAEQMQQANAVVMWQYMQYQQYMLQIAQLQQQQAQQQKAAAAPYSPLSPPSEPIPVMSGQQPGAKRPRAPSDASSTASTDSTRSKRAKMSLALNGSDSPLAPGQKPSHADVMAALRRKCESNQQQPGYLPPSPSYTHRPLAPASRTSLSPPAATTTTTGRRHSPPQIVPGRHTGILRAAAAPPAASGAATAPPTPAPSLAATGASVSPNLAPVPEDPHGSESPSSAAATPRNKLALLLHASESTAAFSPSWQPSAMAATSDVRGAVIPAPAVVAVNAE